MKRQEAYYILIATFVLVFLWIVFSVLHSATDSTISNIINTEIAAIDPTFNTKIITDLKKRIQVTPIAGQPVVTPQSSESAIIIPTPTPAPLTTSTQTATNTGQLTP